MPLKGSTSTTSWEPSFQTQEEPTGSISHLNHHNKKACGTWESCRRNHRNIRHPHLKRLARISRVSRKSFSWVHRGQECSRGKPGQEMSPSPNPAEACLTRDRKRSREKAKRTQQRCEAKPGSVSRARTMKEDAGGGQREMGRRTGVW